jgi:hypothetical protein
MTEVKQGRGRRRQGSQVKKAPLNLRTDPELRARIERSQETHGTPSLVREVERLLRAALDAEAA